MTRLGDYISEFSVKNHLDESIPVYSVTHDRGFCSGYFNKDVASKDKTTYKIVPRGYFAYNPSRINVGSIAWQNSAERVIVSPLYVVFKVSDKLDRQYLLHYLKSDVGMTFIKAHAAGSVRDSLKFSDLKELPIHVVPLEKQRKIARTLDKLDALISQCHQQANSFDTLVKSQFVEMFGDPKLNPNDYPVCPLSEYIDFLTSGSREWAQYCTDNGTEWFITIKNVKDCRISVNNMQSVNAPNNAEARRTKVQEGDLLISITADLGRTGVVTKEIAEHGAYINQHLTCIRLNQTMLHPLYVAHFMESPAGKEQFETKNQSSVKAGLNFDSINSLRIMVPPIDKQNLFAAFVAQVDKSKVEIQKAIDQLEILKKSLMQQYFG